MTSIGQGAIALIILGVLPLGIQQNGNDLDRLGPTFNIQVNRLSSPAQPETLKISAAEKGIIDGINAERKKAGLAPLKPVASLMRAARKHSERMAREKFFDHKDPSGKTSVDRINAEGYKWSACGENIAMNVNHPDPITSAVVGWMKSPGHRANILNGNFTETGVGVVKIGDAYYFTQVFGRPR